MVATYLVNYCYVVCDYSCAATVDMSVVLANASRHERHLFCRHFAIIPFTRTIRFVGGQTLRVLSMYRCKQELPCVRSTVDFFMNLNVSQLCIAFVLNKPADST